MRRIRNNHLAHLRVEELEPRAMLAATVALPTPLPPVAPADTAALIGAGFPADTGTIAAALSGAFVTTSDPSSGTLTGMAALTAANNIAFNPTSGTGLQVTAAASGQGDQGRSIGFDTTTPAGQIALTTGANTWGIESFGSTTAGFNNWRRSGGGS